MVDEFSLTRIDATDEIHDQQDVVREKVSEALKGYSKKRTLYARRAKVFWRKFTVS